MSRQQPPPAFQFYPKDYLSSRAVSCMTLEERGAYVNLLCHAWLSDDPGTLPDDPKILAALSGLGEAWPGHALAIAQAFIGHDGKWIQGRMKAERQAQIERRNSLSRRGRSGAKSKWAKEKDGRAINRPLADACLPMASSSSSSSSSSIAESTSQELAVAGATTGAEWDRRFQEWWKIYRKGHKQPALKNWRKIRPHTTAMFEAIMSGTTRYLEAALETNRIRLDGQGFITARAWDGFEEGEKPGVEGQCARWEKGGKHGGPPSRPVMDTSSPLPPMPSEAQRLEHIQKAKDAMSNLSRTHREAD